MKKWIIPIIMIAAAVASCTGGIKTKTYSDNVTLPAAEGSADSLFMSITLEYLTGGLEDQAVKEIDKALLIRAFDLYEDPSSVEGASVEDIAVGYRESLIDEYLTEITSLPATWEDVLEGAFTGEYKEWINYTLSYYSSRGGVHGIQTVSPIVFDRKSGAILSEADLFADGYADGIAPLLRKAITDSMAAEDPELESLVEMQNVVPNNNFSVGEDGVTWLFQPYEIGPYALGVVSATLSWKDLEPYMK